MLESVIKLPRCEDAYQLHGWLSDRIGSHRTNDVKYLFLSVTSDVDSLMSVFHQKPIPGLSGAKEVKVPEAGQVVKFRARVNPTSRNRSKRVRVSSADLPGWFQRQVRGAEILSCDEVKGSFEPFTRKRESLWVWTSYIEGELRVTDRESFSAFLLEGAGRFKGYGWGMVSIEGTASYRILGL